MRHHIINYLSYPNLLLSDISFYLIFYFTYVTKNIFVLKKNQKKNHVDISTTQIINIFVINKSHILLKNPT